MYAIRSYYGVDFPKGGEGEGQMAYKPGAMGVHFLNPALVGPQLDSLKPQVLIYEPVGDRNNFVDHTLYEVIRP